MNRPAAALDGLGSPLPREGLLPPPVSRRRGACSLGSPSRLAISARLANLSPPRFGEALRLPPLLPACSLLAGRTIVPAAARPGGRASCCEERLILVLSPVSRSETTGGWPTVRRSSPPRAPTHAVAAAVPTPSFIAGASCSLQAPTCRQSFRASTTRPAAPPPLRAPRRTHLRRGGSALHTSSCWTGAS